MIGPLIWLHLEKKRREYRPIDPPDVPILLIFSAQPEIGLVSAILQDLVLCIIHVDDQRPLIHVGLVGVSLLTDQCPASVVQKMQLIPIARRRGRGLLCVGVRCTCPGPI